MLIGLSGGACAGNTTLAKALLDAHTSATLLCFDDYYRDLSHITPEERAAINYDHPDALDTELFVSHMDDLALGKSVDVPEYDMATHTRPGGSHRVEAAPLVVVDGMLAKSWRSILLASSLIASLAHLIRSSAVRSGRPQRSASILRI